jgi:hypothetical protein
MLVDSIGPDELRLSCDGVPMSKQNLRGYYLQTPWKAAVDQAKLLAKQRGAADWKAVCRDELGATPPPLSTEQVTLLSDMYRALANALALSQGLAPVFTPCPPLADIARDIEQSLLSASLEPGPTTGPAAP